MSDRTVVLIRHAKTEPAAGSDLERALTARGRADARAIGEWLLAHDAVPDVVVVSPAARAVQTWEVAFGVLGAAPRRIIDDRIYDNSVRSLLRVIQDVDPAARTVALVGHNPSMGALAAQWDSSVEEMRTASVAVFTVEASDWQSIDDEDCTLTDFATCRG